MAKSTKLMNYTLADIHWFPERNIGRHTSNLIDESTSKTIAVSIASQGWLTGQPLEVSPLSENDVELAVTQRLILLASLENATEEVVVPIDGKKITVTPADMLRAWKKECIKGEKARKPIVGATFGYQRASKMPLILALREKLAAAFGLAKPEDFTIPCIVETYESELERDLACIRENSNKKIGVTDTSKHWASLFVQARAIKRGMVLKGEIFTESALMRKLGWSQSLRGTVQKMFFLLLLDGYATKLMAENPENPATIDVLQLIAENQEVVAAYRFDDMSPEKGFRRYIENGAATLDSIAEFLSAKPATGPKLPSRSVMMARVQNSTNRMEQLVLQAVLANNLGSLASLPAEMIKEMNLIYNAKCPLNTDLSFKSNV